MNKTIAFSFMFDFKCIFKVIIEKDLNFSKCIHTYAQLETKMRNLKAALSQCDQ